MAKSKTNMPQDKKNKCHAVIHTAAVAATAGGASPIPISDAVVISSVQVGMIVALGKIFEISISESVAKSIISVSITQAAGKSIFTNLLKLVPGINLLVCFIGGAVAGSMTEALGWLVADDFYRISIGENARVLVETLGDLGSFYSSIGKSKR